MIKDRVAQVRLCHENEVNSISKQHYHAATPPASRYHVH